MEEYNKKHDNSKIQDFYNSKNHNREVNIIDQRSYCTRNFENIPEEKPFNYLINNYETIVNNENFKKKFIYESTFNYNGNNEKKYNEDIHNYRDVTNNRLSQLSPLNNDIQDFKYLTHSDFSNDYNKNKDKHEINNERIMNINNITYNSNINTQNHYLNDRHMFQKKNNEFKNENNERISQLGQLPSNSSFPINKKYLYEIKSINTRNN